ncbi:MAG: MMPL family transporter, partial [Gammaproteobacteria bacterium]|nr:MMPL family transporter [Gammaproteobacteria bacterium]
MNSFFTHKGNQRLIFTICFILFSSMVMYLINTLNIRSDISFFLPENTTEIDSIMHHQLTQGEAGKMILIALQAKNNSLSTKQLAHINKQLTKSLLQNNDFLMVQNGQLDQSQLIIEPYYQYRYLLNSLADSPHSESLSDPFSAQNLSNSFAQILQRLQLLISPMEHKLFSEDPQMLWFSLLKQWQTQHLEKHHGVWFDPTIKKTLLFVKTRAQGFELEQQQKNVHFLHKKIHEQTSDSEQTIDIILSGAPIFALASKKAISQQTKLISTLASLTLMAFLYWFFRSVKIVLLIALPLGLAILTGITTVLLLDGFIHGITIAFGITIIGIAVDYPIHLYSHALFYKDNSKQNSVESDQQPLTATMQSIWPMIRLGLITTLIGFSAITLSDFSGLRQLGIFAISGLLTAAITTRFLLPLFPVTLPIKLPIFRKQPETKSPSTSFQFLVKLLQYPLPNFFHLLPIALPLLALITIYFHQGALWEKDLSALSPVPQWQKQQDFELRKAMGLPELRYTFILQNEKPEILLQQSEQLIPQLNALKKQGLISGYDMAASYLPSIKYQKTQQQKLPEAHELQKTLEQVLDKTELQSSAFSPFINDIKKSKSLPVLSAEALLSDASSNPISDKIKTLLFQQEPSSLWTAIIPLQGVKTDKLSLNSLKTVNNKLKLLDLKTQSEEMLAGYRNDALVWFFSGLILILAVLLISSKKPSALIPLALPFTGSVILTIASLLLMGYSLSIFHLVTLLLVVGLGIDYSIFTFFSHKNSENTKQASEVAQVSVIICMISTIIMFGALG